MKKEELKKENKNVLKMIKEKITGITLTSLVITIIVLLILASLMYSTGRNVIDNARLSSFTAELQKLQGEVNTLYQKYKNGDNDVLELGEPLRDSEDEMKAFQGAGEDNTEGYQYFSAEKLKEIGIDNIDGDYLINIKKRSVISLQGMKKGRDTYYTVSQVPNGLYIVQYNQQDGSITFNLSNSLDNIFKIQVKNITYTGYIGKGTIYYGQKDDGENINWKIAVKETDKKDYPITVDKPGWWYVKIIDTADNESEEKSIYIDAGVTVAIVPNGGNYAMPTQNPETATLQANVSITSITPGVGMTQYGWSESDSSEPISYSSEAEISEAIVSKTGCEKDKTYYLWIKNKKGTFDTTFVSEGFTLSDSKCIKTINAILE